MPQILHKTQSLLHGGMRNGKPVYTYAAVCGRPVAFAAQYPFGTTAAIGSGEPAVHCATCFKDDKTLKGMTPPSPGNESRLPEDWVKSGSMFDDKGNPLGEAKVEKDIASAPIANDWGHKKLGDTNAPLKTEDHPYGVPPPRPGPRGGV